MIGKTIGMKDRDLPPIQGTITIILYADDVPRKLPDEQAEAKEREFREIRSNLAEFLQQFFLPDNWEMEVLE